MSETDHHRPSGHGRTANFRYRGNCEKWTSSSLTDRFCSPWEVRVRLFAPFQRHFFSSQMLNLDLTLKLKPETFGCGFSVLRFAILSPFFEVHFLSIYRLTLISIQFTFLFFSSSKNQKKMKSKLNKIKINLHR